MRNCDQKNDNLVKLLNGFSLLDRQDQERVIRMVDTLDSTNGNVKNVMFSDASKKKPEKSTTQP